MRLWHLIVIGVMMVLIPFAVLIGISANGRDRGKTTPYVLEVNSIGCTKYLFKGDRYWVCPKDLNINSIESSHACGKSTCTDQEPVISEE